MAAVLWGVSSLRRYVTDTRACNGNRGVVAANEIGLGSSVDRELCSLPAHTTVPDANQ